MANLRANDRGERSWRTLVENLCVLGLYLALTVVMTWPLATGLSRDVPGDLGDSLLNMWILGWGAEQVPRVVAGQAPLSAYWNANIFHPEPLALGFSEHLFGEVIQILPVYWLTGNLILCYNLLFLSSFALSGLAMFLLVRDLLDPGGHGTRNRAVPLAAAFVAGLIFAFVPFRIAQVAHIQSLHAHWMPFALFGFRRYIFTGHWRALAGGTAALLMQNWSNGYYLLFFAPLVSIFVLHQMWAAGRIRDVRGWLAIAVAVAVIVLGTTPFLLLYLETQRVHAFERPIGEVIQFSADVYSYLTAPAALRVWGDVIQAYPKPEGELFFGFVPWILFGVALATVLFNGRGEIRRLGLVPALLVGIVTIQTIGIIAIVFTGGFISSFAGIPVRATNSSRLLTVIAVTTLLLLVVSRPARQRAATIARSPLALFVLFVVLAVWLSLGPLPQSLGRRLAGLGFYRLLYEYVPGFAGLRVPARYGMIAAVFLSVVAGYGAARLLRTWAGEVARARRAVAGAGVIAMIFLAEAWFAPMAVNVTWGSSFVNAPPRVFPRADAPAVYHQLANLRDDVVVAEFPFGDTTWELRYVYYSTVHWKRLVNGYSGGFPHGYRARVALLQRVQDNPEAAWRALKDAGATHVVVHQGALLRNDVEVITTWLRDHFAVEIARFEADLLFDVSGVWPPR